MQRDVEAVGREPAQRVVRPVQERQVRAHARRQVLQRLLAAPRHQPEPKHSNRNRIVSLERLNISSDEFQVLDALEANILERADVWLCSYNILI